MTQNPSSIGEKPIIAVCGARGNQGSAVVRALLKSKKYAIRGVTRHPPSSSEAKSLATLGIEVVQADYDHPDSLRTAFKGCYGVFGVTNWYEVGSHESQQGKSIVDAAKQCDVKHFVWSSSPEVPGVESSSFTTKARVAKHLQSSGMPYTCILIPVYYDSVVLLLSRSSSGGFKLSYAFGPEPHTPLVDISDIGIWVANVFNDPEEWCNRTLNPCTEWLTTTRMAQVLSETTGEECQVPPATPDQFLAQPENEILQGAKSDIEYLMGSYDRQEWSTSLGRQLSPQPRTWRDICEERFKEDEAVMSSPTEESMAAQLDIHISSDHGAEFR